MSAERASRIAVDHFSKGFNCAESALLGLTEALGIESECVPRIATPFGGGMGRYGEVCGAITGALMAMGLKLGRQGGDDTAARDRVYPKVVRLMRACEIEFGAVECRVLTGCDMLTAEGRERFQREKMHTDLCAKLVVFAAEEAYRISTE